MKVHGAFFSGFKRSQFHLLVMGQSYWKIVVFLLLCSF